jgi:hypothetical protein
MTSSGSPKGMAARCLGESETAVRTISDLLGSGRPARRATVDLRQVSVRPDHFGPRGDKRCALKLIPLSSESGEGIHRRMTPRVETETLPWVMRMDAKG